MNILVCVSEVLHPHDIQLPSNGTRAPSGLRMPNRADECAVEMAVRFCGRQGGSVTLLSVAPPESEEMLGMYVGIGAEALVRVWDAVLAEADVGTVAYVLAKALERLKPDLILCGDCALGGMGTGLTGPLLAEYLSWPFVGSTTDLQADSEGGLRVYCLIEHGDRQLLWVPIPAVIAVSPNAPSPRYPALAKIRRAKRETWDLKALDLKTEEITEAALPMTATEWVFARPRPRKLFMPPSTASAAERLRMVMAGGMKKKTQDNFVEESPEKAAEQILQFLRQEKLI